MRFTRLKLENWRNFRAVDVPLEQRVFLVGPNASGKSNVLDALRFLRDVAAPDGGFQRAVTQDRGGVSLVRSLFARRQSNVAIEVEVGDESEGAWSYRLEFTQDAHKRPVVSREVVRRGKTLLLDRPGAEDRSDPTLMEQPHLQQLNVNRGFRELADFFASVRYLHIVPQLVREPDRSVGRPPRDPYGGDFLEQIAKVKPKTRDARLRKILEALKVAVPHLKDLTLEPDVRGVPHLEGIYEHWRPNAGKQNEAQFSDGTLRLIGLLWALQDGSAPLLLEEPELSLHTAIVRHIPGLMARIARKSGRQVVVSTHSADLLQDPGIAPEEVLMLIPGKEGTSVMRSADDLDVRRLLDGGLPVGEAVLPRVAPDNAAQLSLFGG